jgi:Tol biopolymer transport system component
MRLVLLTLSLGVALTTAFSSAVVAGARESGASRSIVFTAVNPTRVLTVRSDGVGLREVAASATHAQWSPDGTRLVFTTLQTNAISGIEASGLQLELASTTGGTPAQLTTGADTAVGWSPNGRLIAFIRSENGNGDLFVIHPDGTGQKLLSRAIGTASWAPDSLRLIVSVRRRLALVDLRGRSRALPRTQCSDSGALSPNGMWLAFSPCVSTASRTGVAVERLNGSGFRWLAKPVGGSGNSDPVWSPDGTRLAYVEEHPIAGLEHTEIRMVSFAGRNLGNLDSYAQDHDEYPQWSPDGRQIVFDRDAALEPVGESDRLFVGDVRSGRVRQLYEFIDRGTQSWRPR